MFNPHLSMSFHHPRFFRNHLLSDIVSSLTFVGHSNAHNWDVMCINKDALYVFAVLSPSPHRHYTTRSSRTRASYLRYTFVVCHGDRNVKTLDSRSNEDLFDTSLALSVPKLPCQWRHRVTKANTCSSLSLHGDKWCLDSVEYWFL